MGKYGRPKLTAKNNTVHLSNLSESGILRFIKAAIQYLNLEVLHGLKKEDTDLVNIRDDMLGQLNQLMYLFTLK
jgi:hypothetical protein